MILIRNLSKRYGNTLVLSDINIEISSYGMIGIYGPSGCGKSSLMNILSLADCDYEGEYLFNGIDVKKLTQRQKEEIVTNYITYMFQESKFIEEEDVITNISLFSNLSIDKEQLIKMLEKFNLNVDIYRKVKFLSKGERKRIEIIGMLFRNNKIIICDEITSGLDKQNSEEVFKLLNKISKSHVIFIVSHDVELLKQFCDSLYYLKNHTFPKIIIKGRQKINKNNLTKNNKLSNHYLFNHALGILINKRYRTLILIISMVLCLFTMGLSILISETMKNDLINSLTSYFNTNTLILKSRNQNGEIDNNLVVDENEFANFIGDYNEYITDSQSFYLANFENMFIDENFLMIDINSTKITLDGYGVNNINTFVNKELLTYDCYPSVEKEMAFDEVILSLNEKQIFQICSTLRLPNKNYLELEKYFYNNYLNCKFYIANYSWEYYLEIPLKIIGFVRSDKPCIIHSNYNFNKYFIENLMQLPYSYYLNQIDYYPWTIKKLCSLVIDNHNLENFYYQSLYDSKMNKYQLNILGDEYLQYFDFTNGYSLVYFTYFSKGHIPLSEIENIQKLNSQLQGYIPCTSDSYTIDSTSLFNGFSLPTYFSNDININNEFIDYNSFSDVNLGSYQSSVLLTENQNFLSLGMLDCTKNNFVKFIPYYDKKQILYQGSYPKNAQQLLISSALRKHLECQVGDTLYFTILKEIKKDKFQFQNIFETIKITICGIFDSNEMAIYQENIFPLMLSKVYFKLNSSHKIDSYMIKCDNNSKNLIEKLNNQFPQYEFFNPLDYYIEQITKSLNYISLGLLIFSLLILVSSLSMMILVNFLFIKEGDKEIAIYSFWGYQKKSIFKLFTFIFGLVCFFSTLLSFTLLFIISFAIPLIEPTISKLSLSFWPFALIIFVGCFSFIFVSILMIPYFKKQDVIKLIKK